MDEQITNMLDGGKLTYIKEFMTKEEADKMYNELRDTVPWTHGVYKMWGKEVKTPRLLYAMCDDGDDINSSYKVTNSIIWLPSVKELKEKIEKYTGKQIKYAQLNFYRDGNDYIGYHTDSEVKDGDIIASISLGAPREFAFRHKKYEEYKNKKWIKSTHSIILGNGSLVIMNNHAAKGSWKHSILKVSNELKAKNTAGRINITFREK